MTPANALDPQVMLATAVHAQPGVYALLLGSGISTGAGIPTGWGVVRELVRRAAAASDPDDVGAVERAHKDPEAWWAVHGDGAALGYSNLLAAMAPTPAARQALLAGFFEPSAQDIDDGLKVPGPAHRAIAELVRRGSVRVIVTTNFDRLTERALEEAGVSPQVIASTGSLTGMAPLQHARATVIKLHGDYADLQMRNTIEGLATYPAEWEALLDRVLSEFGLLISGWSADWDTALVGALERTAVRRYPLFWHSRSAKGDNASRLLATHGGRTIPAGDADRLFTGLTDRLEALDRLAEPPLTTALAVARLKRYMQDDNHRIDLHDLVMGQVRLVVHEVAELPAMLRGDAAAHLEELMAHCESSVAPLATLVMVGIQHDHDGRFSNLWIEALQRLLRAPRPVEGSFHDQAVNLRRYPALLLLRAAGLACVRLGRDQLLVDLFTEPTWRPQFYDDQELVAANALADYAVMNSELINAMPRYGGTRRLYPTSHYLREVLEPLTRDLLGDGKDYRFAHDDFEYAAALVQEHTASGFRRPMPGEFIGESGWNREGLPHAEVRFRARADIAPEAWPWFRLLGAGPVLDTFLESCAGSSRRCSAGVEEATVPKLAAGTHGAQWTTRARSTARSCRCRGVSEETPAAPSPTRRMMGSGAAPRGGRSFRARADAGRPPRNESCSD